MRETLLCEVVDDGFGWFDELVVYNDARLVVDHADPGQFLAVFCQALPRAELEWAKKKRQRRTISQSMAYTLERCFSCGRSKIDSVDG